ncbi:acyl-CoA dehydrogenase domain-containing protein, partial [Escherichia sp. R-CC3]
FTRLDELAHNALAKGLIDKDEAAILVKAEESRLRSINVDDFDPEELATKPVKLPEIIMLRVRMLAPSTVMAIGAPW